MSDPILSDPKLSDPELPASQATGNATEWVAAAARAADDKLGIDTVIIDVGPVIAITGYFVITSGRNTRQVRAIVDDIEAVLTAAGGPKPLRVEGRDDHEWVLMDFGDFVVHVFNDESREYYELERLWGDRPRVDFKVP